MSRRVFALLSLAILLGPLAVSGSWAAEPVSVRVLENDAERTLLEYQFGDFTRQKAVIDGQPYLEIVLPGEGIVLEEGAPALPYVSRSLIVPDASRMTVEVLDGDYYEVEGVDVAPSKGNLSRQIDPATVPYTFGAIYQDPVFWPAELATLGEPYILRDHRGIVVRVNPILYNPATGVLRVYTRMTVAVRAAGPDTMNVLRRDGYPRSLSLAFHDLYAAHFLNYNLDGRYSPLDESGNMLIIVHDAWNANVQALATHKNAVGIGTTVVNVSTIGNNSTAIKNYIQNLYNTSDLAFVLLVGDAAQVATYYSGGASDPTYAKVAGGDNYPDIMVGRFSAETAAQVDTQVLRTVEYEQLPATLQSWFWKGMGVASNQGPGDDGEYDYVHIGNIRTILLANGYTSVDEIYDPTGTAAMVTSGLNAGRGIINYCGHGSPTSWGSTGFSNSNVAALTNDNMLPFILSVACNNGEFDSYTCFAEAWMRSMHGTEPIGAIGTYMSTISQAWNPPMEMEDEFADLYTAETYHGYGTLCYAGSCSMMDVYGSAGVTEFNAWTIFGDPSLRVVGTAAPPEGLGVSPSGGLVSEGPNGGPFAPGSLAYTLTNYETTPLNYTVAKTQSWVTLSGSGGTIPGSGTATVTVSINAAADSLPNGLHTDTVTFTNTTSHIGDTTRGVQLTVGVPVVQYEWNLDSNPGWTISGGQWAFGVPTGGGGQYGNNDPTSGRTGSNVYGYNLSGDYANSIPEYHLTTAAIDCSQLTQVNLKFWRWLNVETPSYDHAYVRVSTNGSTWTLLWQNASEVTDAAWSQQEFDLSSVADGQATVYVRWTMGTTDSSWQFSGWNIDDVQIYGVGEEEQPTDSVSANLGCVPGSGVVPFTSQFTVNLSNLLAVSRRAAARIEFDAASGSHYGNWRSGWTNLGPLESFSKVWNQTIPGSPAVIGQNVFTLIAMDVTPSPFNQPPYVPSGDTDTGACTVTGIAP